METIKGNSGLFLDTRTFQEILHEIFVELSDYSVKELAFFLGEEMATTYKYVEGVRSIKIDWGRRVIQFIHMKNPHDMRLLDFFIGPADCMAVPRVGGKRGQAIQMIMLYLAELAKGDSE